MTALHSVPLDADRDKADLCTSGDERCDVATRCSVCDAHICPEHSDDFTTCSDGDLHCGDCRGECRICQGDMAYDDYEDRYERTWRGED